MEQSHEVIALHVIIVAIAVWLLPNFILTLLIAYLTRENPYVCLLLKYIKQQIKYLKQEEDEVVVFVKNHYGTLKRIISEHSIKN